MNQADGVDKNAEGRVSDARAWDEARFGKRGKEEGSLAAERQRTAARAEHHSPLFL